MVVVFLFNLMCAIVSCDPFYPPPAPRPQIADSSQNNFLKEFRAGRNLDLYENSLDWKPPEPVVQTKIGMVEGYFMKVISGREVYAFEGIPYAEPPMGDRRFRAPVPKRPWSGTRQAKKPGHLCTQLHPMKMARVVGHEDCLSLNIYSPMISFQDYNPKIDVVIFIHGGGFVFGGGSEYGPAMLLQKDVVLVTINYRVGPLGFLSSGDEEAPGNWGLKDQALAIKWVSENIEYFGGNSSSITIMGQSAGGASVHFQMMSNLSNHLFHRAISMSGTALNFWAIYTPHQARKWAEKLAKFMRCPISSSAKMMNCFRKRNANFLTANMWNLFDVLTFPPVILRPVIEPDLPGAFLTVSPTEVYQRGQVVKIPFLVTATEDEGDFARLFLKSMGVLRLILRNWQVLLPTFLDYRKTAGDNSSAVTNAITNYYFDGVSAKDIWRNSDGSEFSKVASDRYFHVGIRKTLKAHSQIAPTYSYIFNLTNSKGYASLFRLPPGDFRVSHGEDMMFLFNNSLYWESFDGGDGHNMQIADLLLNLFGNFFTKGEPLYTGKDGKDYSIWEPVKDPDDPRFLHIDKTVEMISDPVKPEVEFWESLKLNDSFAYEYA